MVGTTSTTGLDMTRVVGAVQLPLTLLPVEMKAPDCQPVELEVAVEGCQDGIL